MLISLKDLISEIEDEKLNELLSSFKCNLDPDIEFFLKSRAVTYEKLSKARTYLIVDENDLATKAIEDITILGYIALALKVLTVPESVSNRMRREIDGLSAKIHGEQITAFPVYLIGQLGRNTNISKEVISGKDLIGYGDAVLFGAEAERIYQHSGIEAFQEHERSHANDPLPKGPFANFLTTLSNIQTMFPNREETPIRTALVTSRNAPAHERAVKTLRAWNVRIDEAFFLGGVSKKEILDKFGAHIFFDDQRTHTDPAAEVVASAVVPYREGDDPSK